jgi:surfeit locus 1 family protein
MIVSLGGGSRPFLLPTLFMSVAVLLCLGLAVWQVDRLSWKRGLIAERVAASQAPPVALPRDLAEARTLEFRPVRVEGVFLHDKEIFLGAAPPSGRGTGFHVLTPLRQPDGRTVFINRGYVPSELKDPARREAGLLDGTVQVTGLLRMPRPRPNRFVPDNRPDLNYWFWIDLPAISAATGLSEVAPFYIDADAAPNPGGWPSGGVTPIDLPNDHLQYAITWFLLAAAGGVIYVLWRRQAAQGRDRATTRR